VPPPQTADLAALKGGATDSAAAVLPLIGVTLAADPTARWLEAQPDAVECVEIAAEGFFARPSPYLAWLGSQQQLVLRAPGLSIGSPDPLPDDDLTLLRRLSEAASPRFIVHPLAVRAVGDIRLRGPAPIGLHPASLRAVATNLAKAPAAGRGRALVEPVTTPLRVGGPIGEPAFLGRLCETTDCGLLVDVTSLLVASRNHGLDTHAWLRDIPGHRVAVARIGGSAIHRGRCQQDPGGAIEEEAWDLLGLLLSRATPEILILDHRDRPDGVEGVQRELERLRRAGAAGPKTREVSSSAPNETGTRADHLSIRTSPGPRVSSDPALTARQPGVASAATSQTPQIAPGVGLFVLDREGVFVSEPRHELTLFNTAATFVWCLLEEGRRPQDIAIADADTFGAAPDEAERHVGNILRQWFGRGYLTHPGSLPAAPTPFVTALAWLLTNPPLRARFRLAPGETADLLGVDGEERDAFVALDPDELDAQAEGETPDAGTDDTPDDAGNPRAGSPAQAAAQGTLQHYRLLTTTFAVRCESPEIARQIHEALGHLSQSAVEPDVAIDVRDGWQIFENGAVVTELRSPEAIVPAVKHQLRLRAVERHPFLVSVHAGVVAFGSDCVLLPASAGSGKTTLTAALVQAGATYFSDEIALLDDRTLAVTPVPLSLTVKDGSLEPLRALYPELDTLMPHVREDYVRVRYLPPPAASLPPPDASARARWIVFPRYSPGVDTALHPLDRPAGLRRLLDESYVRPGSLTRAKVEAMVQWMRTVDCYELPFSSLPEAVALVAALPGRNVKAGALKGESGGGCP
jgi:uncharacterized protein (UPF0276 family)